MGGGGGGEGGLLASVNGYWRGFCVFIHHVLRQLLRSVQKITDANVERVIGWEIHDALCTEGLPTVQALKEGLYH